MSSKIKYSLVSIFVLFCAVIFFYLTGCCSKGGGGGSGFVAGSVGGGQSEPKLFDVKVNEDGSITKTLAPSGRLSIEAPKNTLNKEVVVHMVENQAIGNESDIYAIGKYIYTIKPDREEKNDTGIKTGASAKRDVKMQTNPIILTFSDDERLTGTENYYIGIKEIGSKEWQFVNVYSATNPQINSNGPKGFFEYKLYKDNVLVALFGDFNNNLVDRPKVLSMVASMPDNVIEILDGRYNEDAVIKLKFIGDNLSSLRADDYKIRLHYANTDSKQVNIRIDGKTANYISGTSTNKYEAFGELYAHYYEFIPTTATYTTGVTPELSFTLNFKKFPIEDFSSDFVVEAFNATDKPVPFSLSDSLHFDMEEEKEPEPTVATMTVVLSLASDSTHIFDTAKNLYYLNPRFTITASPSYEFTDEAKAVIASSVTLVEMNTVVRANIASSTDASATQPLADEELLTMEWNENGLELGFRQKLATYTQYVISMNDISGLEGINIESFSSFSFRTAGTVDVTIASDSSNVIDVENNLYHCRPLFTVNPGFNPNDSEKAAIASAVTVIGAEDGIVTKTWNGSILSVCFSRNLAADTEYTVSMNEPAGMKRLCLNPFQPFEFKTTGDYYIALVPDADNIFDTENSLYRCRPGFTITPSTALSDEDQAKIASAVVVTGVEEASIQKIWASGSLTISFTQDIGQNTEFTLSISDLPEIEGRNFITFQPFVFKTMGALELALTPDADNVYTTVSPLYHCRPGFTITPGVLLNEEDRVKIANAVSVSNVEANQITKTWDNEGKLIIGFSQNLVPATEYILSLSAVNNINGVTVNAFEPLAFTTVGNLVITLTPDANNIYNAANQKYRCNPGFTITPAFALKEEDRAKVANAITIASAGASVVKNWEGNNLRISLNQNLATDSAYMLSMSAVNDIKGINVVPFEALNFTTVGALGFTVTPDEDNVYAAVSPKYQCRPGFTITPAITINDEDKAKIADAVTLSNAGNIASKTWDANSLKITLTQNLATDTAYTLSMAAVDDINGVTVTPFTPVEFTTIGELTFTVTPDDDNLFDIPNSLTHCKPGFTITPAFALNDADKTKILNAVTVADVASSSLVRQWNNEGNLYLNFNTKLASGTDYRLNMADVPDIKGVTVTAFDPQPFRTMNAINVTLVSEDSNVIDVQNNLYHCRPQFTVTPGYDADDSAKEIIASAVTVIGADENNITRNWVNDSLVIGFTSNLTTNTEYTVSIGDLNASFEKLAFRLPEPLTFTTTGDSYVAIVPDEGNVIVSIPNELYHCRPTFTITPSVALGDSDRATIAGAIHVSNVLDENLTKNWNASGSLILGFSQNLTHDTQYTVSINPIGEIAGVNLVLFQPLTFRTVPGLNLVLTADDGNEYEALSSIYRCNPAFTITPNFALSDANKAIIADAVSVSNSAVTLKNWEGNNLRVTFSSNLAPNSSHTISMADVNSITGVTVTSFIPQTFTTVPELSFTLDSPNSNVFVSTPAERYHCRPVFTITPAFTLNAEDRTKIANAVTISSNANLMTKTWNGNVLEIGFSSDLANNTNYTLSMNAVSSISGVSVTQVTPKSFTTIEELVISIASDSGDLFTIENGVGLYQTLPTFTVTSNMALSATDQTTIANAISVSNIDDPYKVTKSWANATTLNISFTENLSHDTNYTISMGAVNISGVSVTGFSNLAFRTMETLTIALSSDAGNIFISTPELYHCRPAFTVTSRYALNADDKAKIAGAVTLTGTDSAVLTKNWTNDKTLRLTFGSDLGLGSSHTLSMNAVTNITGVTVIGFADKTFNSIGALTFALASDSGNIYEAMDPLSRCNPAFTISPNYALTALSAENKTDILNAVDVTNSNVTSKVWNNDNIRVTFTQNLEPDTAHTLSMSSVDSITGVTVSPFASQDFTTVPALTFTLNSPASNVFVSTPAERYHCRPVFTLTPAFTLNAEDRTKIANAVTISSNANLMTKTWNDNVLEIGFSDDLPENTEFTLSMNAVSSISGVTVTPFTAKTFTTVGALVFSIASDSGDVFAIENGVGLYQTLPTFTVTSNMPLSDTDKAKIEAVISVSNVDDSNIRMSWSNASTLNISFRQNLANDTAYTISMAAVNNINGVSVNGFANLPFRTMEPLTFTATPDLSNVYGAMDPKYHCRPAFTISPNYSLSALSNANRTVLLNAVAISNSSGLTKAWDGDNIRLTFSSNLTPNSSHTLSMAAVDFTGITVNTFANLDFTVLDTLTFAIATGSTDVYEAMSPKYRLNPTFTITPSFNLTAADKTNIENAVSVTNSNITLKSWDNNNLVITFSENLTPNRTYTLKMGNVSGMGNISLTKFSDLAFTTLPALSFTLTRDSDNVFSGLRYHCRPGFTVTPSFTVNDDDKSLIADAISLTNVSDSIITKTWNENVLTLGFNQNIATNTSYTLSMSEINNISGVRVNPFSSLSFTTITDLIVSITPTTASIVKIANSSSNNLEVNGKNYLYCQSPQYEVSVNMGLDDTNGAKIKDAISGEGAISTLLTKSAWNGNKFTLGFSSILAASTTYRLLMSDVTDIKGVNVKTIPSYSFTTFFHNGKGTEADPFTIYTPAQLACLDYYPNQAYFYKQMEDLDLSVYANWKPIGSSTRSLGFHGNYNGNNKRISNAVINYPDTDYIGLFACSNSAVFSNINLDNFTVSGGKYVGCGLGRTISLSTIATCNITNSIVSGDSYVGGYIGDVNSNSNISEITCNGVTVDGLSSRVGCAIGSVSSCTVTNCNVTNSLASGTSYVGGCFGSVSGNSNVSEVTCDEVTVYGNNSVGCALGYLRESTVTTCNVTNSVASGSYVYVGGCVGYIYINGNISEVTCNEVRVNGNRYVGSGFGHVYQSTITNCNVTNSLASGTSYVGGCAGGVSSNSNISGVTCDEVGVNGNERIGGVFGYIGGSTITTCNVTNSTATGTSRIGGCIGSAESSSTVSDVTCEGLIVKATDENSGGFVGYTENNCSFTDITCNDVNVEGNGYVGGAFGLIKAGTLTTCNITNSIASSSGWKAGGCAGQAETGANLSGVVCENLQINAIGHYAGGCIGQTFGNCVFSDILCDNVSVESVAGKEGLGGLMGYCINSTKDNCRVVNSRVGNGSSNLSCGGLVGILGHGYGDTSTTNCFVRNTDILSTHEKIGGLFGYANNARDVSNCFAEDCRITGSNRTGGFSGEFGGDTRLNSCYVASISLDTTGDYIGGFVGHSQSSITSCYSERVKILARSHSVGGLAGYQSVDGVVDQSHVTKAQIDVDSIENRQCYGGLIGQSSGTVRLSYVDQSNIRGVQKVAGLVGFTPGGTISKCFVKDTTVTGYEFNIGGLTANLFSEASMDSCYITGCSIISPDELSASNYTISGLVATNAANITNCYMYNSTVTGKADYGALVGVNGENGEDTTISDCFISQNYSKLIGSNGSNAPVNCYYNVNDLSTFNGKTWSDGAWSNFNRSVFPPKLTELPEP